MIGEVKEIIDKLEKNGMNAIFFPTAEQARGKRLLVCFWDMHQPASQECIRQLAAQADELAKKGVVVVSVQTSDASKEKLQQWLKKFEVGIPVGSAPAGVARAALEAWAVHGLPWLILTDDRHIVRAEGFPLDELKVKLAE